MRVPLGPDAQDMPDTRALAEASGLPGIPDAAPVYDIDVRDACWVAPGAPLAGVTHIRVPETVPGQEYTLSGDLHAPSGVHDLCLRFTGSKTLPLPALGRMQLRR